MCVYVYVYAKNNSSIIFCFITVCFFLGLGAEKPTKGFAVENQIIHSKGAF